MRVFASIEGIMNRLFAASGWILLTTVVLVVALLPFDPALSQFAQSLPSGLVEFNRQITDFGTFGWMIYSTGILAVLAYVLHRVGLGEPVSSKAKIVARVSFYLFLSIGAASALVHVLKLLIGRARPGLFAEYGAYSLTPFSNTWMFESFPSGHSTAVGAFFGALAMLAPRFRPLFAILALAIGISRVVVGAHYPSDVAAGLLLGLWAAVTAAFLFASAGWVFHFNKQGWPAA